MSVVVLKRLRAKRLVEFDALRDLARRSTAGGEALFLPSVNLLFLLGLVLYRPKTDSFEYVGPT